MTLTKVSETATTITLGWTPPAGVGGYVLYANGVVVSVATARLKDGTLRSSAKFSKDGSPFTVAATCLQSGIYLLDVGKYPIDPPPLANTAFSNLTEVVT